MENVFDFTENALFIYHNIYIFVIFLFIFQHFKILKGCWKK